MTFQGSTTLFAQFNLAGAAPGSYDLVVTDGAQKATEPSAFTVTSNASPGHISYNLSVPSISRPGRIAYLTLTYSNDGGSNALAPLFVVSVTSGNATIGLPGETSFSGSSVQILGIETTGPAGTLPPGYQGTLLIPYESTTLVAGASINFCSPGHDGRQHADELVVAGIEPPAVVHPGHGVAAPSSPT